jgi:AcrR family transcriptional regulator
MPATEINHFVVGAYCLGRGAPRLITRMVNKTTRRRTRGRPKTGHSDDVRQAILVSSRDLFLRYGYRAVSSRQIAAAAGANVAMIRYYFGGKPGLYREMIEGMLAPIRVGIDAMRANQAAVDLPMIMAGLARLWAANPWIPGMMIREVLSPEGPLRAIFLRDIASKVVPIVEQIVAGEIERGRLRAGMEPKLVVLAMMSLVAFPFLTLPVSSKLLGVSTDDEFVNRFIRHVTRVFEQGCAMPAKQENEG